VSHPADPDAAPPEWLQEGRIIGGGERLAYRLGPFLHAAESAWLHAVVDEFGRSLVLKLLRPQPSQGEAPEIQWQREVRLLSRVHHPGVVRLHDAFRLQHHHALVLERADLSLEGWIERQGPMPEAPVRDLAAQLLDALAAVHRAGVIHLDLSPANVLLHVGDGSRLRTLIADFGIGVCLQDQEELGRPSADWALLPPELLEPGLQRPTPRCDLYALGHTLLFALRGSLPLTNLLPHDEVKRRLRQGLFHQLALQLGTPFGDLLATLLQVDPALRPASALDAWRVLRTLA
jgi:serine/threonine protein kinase